MSFSLFQLVPAIYRLRDGQVAATMQLLTPAEQTELTALQTSLTPLDQEQQALLAELTAKSTRGPLESLLMVIDEQLANFAADLDQLYDNQFIETCAPWVIPYIGDLIGYKSIQGIAASVDDPRSEVANTISMRRRKGTVLVLEQLARDVTGWGAHAEEFFLKLGTTQYVKCLRLANHYAPDVRGWKPRAFRNSAFSTMARKVDVHNPQSPGLPRYNLPSIGIFLWSIEAISVTNGTPAQATTSSGPVPECYRFSSLGYDMPLFHAAVYQGEQITAAATESNVPDYLTRHELCADLEGRGREILRQRGKPCAGTQSAASESLSDSSVRPLGAGRSVEQSTCGGKPLCGGDRSDAGPRCARGLDKRIAADAERELQLRLQRADGRRRV